MPEEQDFFSEHHLLYRRVSAETAEAVRQQQLADIQFLEQVEVPIHVVIDTRFATWHPTTLSEMKAVLVPMESPNLRWLIMIVGGNPILKFLIATIIQITVKSGRIKIVESLEEAFRFLEERDATLNLHDLLREIEAEHR